MPQLDLPHLSAALAYFAASVAVVAFAKWTRDLWALRRGFRLKAAIAEDDNAAVAVEQSAFVLATVIGLLGALRIPDADWLEQAGEFAATALIVLASLLFSERVTARWTLRGLDLDREVNAKGNTAVAVVRGGGVVATALVVRAALGHDSLLWERLVWVAIGQAALLLLTLLYQRLTPYDDVAETAHRNLAAALPLAGIQLAVGLVVEAALRGEGSGWGADLASVGIDLAIAAVVLPLLRWLGDLLLLQNTSYTQEIAKDRNAGAGFVEATSYISGAWAIAYFIS